MQHDSLYRINVIFNKNKWKEEQVFEKIVLFIQSVGGTQYLELGTAVNRITYFLLLRSKCLNEFLCQHIPLFQERSCLQHRLIHNFRFALSVSFCRKAIFGNTSFNQIANNRFRTSLRKTLIVSVISFIVTMSSKLDGYIRVIVQQSDQFVKRSSRCRGKVCPVEFIENILD